MSRDQACFNWCGPDLELRVRLQPRSSRNCLGSVRSGWLQVQVQSPPVDGQANAALIKYLAQLFKVPPTRISLLSGQKGRHKRLLIPAPRRLPELVGEPPGGWQAAQTAGGG